MPDPLVRELARLAAAEALNAGPDPPPERAAVIRERIEDHYPVRHAWSGLAFRFPEPPVAHGDALEIPADARLAAAFPKLAGPSPVRPPVFAVMRDGAIASVAYCATAPGRAAEVGVDTQPAYRGEGLAGQAVSAWAAAMHERGVIPLYSVASDNTASLAVAGKLRLIQYATDFHFR